MFHEENHFWRVGNFWQRKSAHFIQLGVLALCECGMKFHVLVGHPVWVEHVQCPVRWMVPESVQSCVFSNSFDDFKAFLISWNAASLPYTHILSPSTHTPPLSYTHILPLPVNTINPFHTHISYLSLCTHPPPIPYTHILLLLMSFNSRQWIHFCFQGWVYRQSVISTIAHCSVIFKDGTISIAQSANCTGAIISFPISLTQPPRFRHKAYSTTLPLQNWAGTSGSTASLSTALHFDHG